MPISRDSKIILSAEIDRISKQKESHAKELAGLKRQVKQLEQRVQEREALIENIRKDINNG